MTLLQKVKIEKTTLSTLAADTLELQDENGQWHAIGLNTLGQKQAEVKSQASAWLAPSSVYGRVMELVGAPQAALDLMGHLSMKMWILPWASMGKHSVLAALSHLTIEQQAKWVCHYAVEHPELDLGRIDVALCVSNTSPGWTGGPLSWMYDEHESHVPSWTPQEQHAWQTVKGRLQQLYG